MPKQFEDYVSLAQTMQATTGTRKDIFTKMDEIYNLKPSGMPTGDWVHEIVSPDPRNRLIGGARMLSAADLSWDTPYVSQDMKTQSDEWKAASGRMWKGASLVGRKPVHFDMSLSAMQYSEIHMRVILVSDMLQAMPSRKLRLDQIALRTPVLFEVINPKLCYALTDRTGLVAHLVKRQMLWSEVKGISDQADKQQPGKKLNDTVNVLEMYDEENHVVWVEGQGDPLIMTPIINGVIPVVYATVEGSDLFNLDTNVDACQPFNYTVQKSGMWNMQNLQDTLIASQLFVLGSVQFVANVDQNTDLVPDYSVPGGVIKVGTQGSMGQLQKTIFGPDMQAIANMIDQKVTESTMYATALGQSPGMGSSYSLAALLSNNGRQSLIPYQRMVEHAASMGMTTAFQLLKQAKVKVMWPQLGADKKEFDVSLIPDDIMIDAHLEIELPTDEAQNADMAIKLTSGDHPLMSVETARKRLLKINESNIEDTSIVRERTTWNQLQIDMQNDLMQGTQQGLPPGAAPQGMPAPQQMPQPQEQAGPGMPLTGPQPPIPQGGPNLGAMPQGTSPEMAGLMGG